MGREQLGDAAAVGGGVDVEDPRAPERLGQLADALDRVRADDARRSRRGASRAAGHVRALDASDPCDGRRAVERSIYCTMPRAVACPDKFRGTLVGRRRPRPRWPPGLERRASTTSSSCRSPTAAKARSTRCSRRAAGRVRTATCHRAARRSGRRRVGVCCPAAIAVIEMARASGLALVGARQRSAARDRRAAPAS